MGTMAAAKGNTIAPTNINIIVELLEDDDDDEIDCSACSFFAIAYVCCRIDRIDDWIELS